MMNTTTLTQEAEAVLLELFNANLCSIFSLETLKKLHHGVADLAALLDWLLDFGYLSRCGGDYELSFAGVQLARQLQAEAQGSQFQDSATDDLPSTAYAPYLAEVVPLVDTHPLRSGTQHLGGAAAPSSSTKLHYILAFEAPKNALPTPVLDCDVLGRQAEADICLCYDNFISGRHCRFQTEAFGDRLLLYVEDLGSRNGTYVNGERLTPRSLQLLEHGSRIKVGGTVMIVLQIPY